MLAIAATPEWRAAYPGAAIGLLELSAVENGRPSPRLDEVKRETEARLRARYQGFSRQDFLALPVMGAYSRYYRRFGKSYHVLLQLESVALKGKPLPSVSPLVDANFTAELETLILTAGHDAARLREPVRIDVARDGEAMTQMSGTPKALPVGDMIMRDAGGVSCSIIYGQDDRSPISAATTHVVYVAYAPAGVLAEAVGGHLRLVEEHVRLGSTSAVLEQRQVLVA